VNDYATLLENVRSAPRGRRTAAFFDFDGTLIDGYSAMAMMQLRARRREMSPVEVARLLMVGVEAGFGRADFERFMRVGVQAFRGRQVDDMAELGERLMRSVLGGSLYPEGWELVAAHRRRGHTVVIATSALSFQVGPLARELGVDNVLCTELEERDGVLTGEVDGPILWGPGKAAAVRAYARRHRIDLERSFAYGNGSEDVQFLETVGRPTPVNPSKELARVAGERGWPTARFDPKSRPGLEEVGRTVAAYGGLTAGLYAGLGVGLLKRSRKDAMNTTMSLGSDVGLSLAGIKLDVSGEEHLWSQRPAVFIFNHQSWLDGMIIMKLLRQDVTAVAKKEVSRQPVMGQIGWLMNMAFVDRGDPTQAKKALEPVIDRIHEGYSLAISPEGTRSATPRVGPFKKGAFHMAMQSGVPIVPIVIRNAGLHLWRGSLFMRKGTIDVTVLPPISVADWTRKDLNERVAGVRQLFVDTLGDWPVNGHATSPERRLRAVAP
jgi:HAD superfamily hydrolase (TIGR01490 family)